MTLNDDQRRMWQRTVAACLNPFYSSVCATYILFVLHTHCFVSWHSLNKQRLFFLNNINWLVFVMKMYAFSVRCELKFTIIQINDCSGKKEENHEKKCGRNGRLSVWHAKLERSEYKAGVPQLKPRYSVTVVVYNSLYFHTSCVRINCFSKIMQFVSIYAFWTVSFIALRQFQISPEFWEAEHWKNCRLLNVAYRKWELYNGYLVCEEI
jgi:hypothetical protein